MESRAPWAIKALGPPPCRAEPEAGQLMFNGRNRASSKKRQSANSKEAEPQATHAVGGPLHMHLRRMWRLLASALFLLLMVAVGAGAARAHHHHRGRVGVHRQLRDAAG